MKIEVFTPVVLIVLAAITFSGICAADNVKKLADPIYFDDLEIVFGLETTWTYIDNQFSDHYMSEVFLLPMYIKNLKDSTHGLNMFDYTQYGSKGTKLDRVGAYFDGEVTFAGKMRSGATLETFMAFLYDGNGDYFVEFSKLFGDTVEFGINVDRNR